MGLFGGLANYFGGGGNSQYKDVAGNIWGSKEAALNSSNDYVFTDPTKYGSATVSEISSVNPSSTSTGLSGLSGLSALAGGAGDLMGAYTGYKQYQLAKDAFNFNKDMKEKEYAMAKDAYDRNVTRANSVGSQMQAGKVG